ncbi:MAG TPA: cell surface protein SprA [Gemmatimonadales bacterium]
MRRPALVVLFATSLVVPPARAQGAAADTGGTPAFVARFSAWALAVAPVAALQPGGRLGSRVPAALLAARWERDVRARWRRALTAPGAAPGAPTLAQGPAEPGQEAPGAPPLGAPRVFQGAGRSSPFGQYADIGMQLNLRFELKADQFRNLKCTSFERQQAISGCTAGFPTITPNPQYAIRTTGVVGQRLHVNVDFDSQREFDANNNLQVWYEGLEDEVLRRVEAGNVSFSIPSSRFISAAIPANNFGVQAIAQFGAMEVRGIYAQQKGNVVKDRQYTVGETTSQPLDRAQRDLDYEPGRFFFAVDPAAIAGYPAVDILSVDAAGLADSLRVGSLRVYRMRAVAPGSTGNQNLGGVRAVACGVGIAAVDCAHQRAGPFQWEILQEGRDYYVDPPSGAWLALTSRLDQSDYLAVSYVPAGQADCTGPRRCVGTFPVTATEDPTHVDTLRLVYDPRPAVSADSSTFRFEIRSAYRVGGQEVDRSTVQLGLTVNQRERTVSSGETYLAHLGLALANDPNTFDQYNRLFPRARDPQQGAALREYYVVFPHLQPFGDATRLTAEERNDSLYRTPRALLATQAPPSVFMLHLHASVSASQDRSTLSLNSFQIRDGSERIFVGNTQLARGVDYDIDYASGQVTFRNADSLFGAGTSQVRAQFEERAAFAVAPTSIYGLAARYDLGTVGEVDLTGLFQREQSAFTRPPLGLEPSASFIGGLSTRLNFQPGWLTRAVDALPGVHTEAPSFLSVAGEVAVSKPSPNPLGQAYVEEFEAEGGRFIPLNETAWHWGSIPTTARGADPFGISGAFNPLDAAFLTWQSLPVHLDGRPVQFLAQDIDPNIRVSGQAQSAEPVLWLTLKPDTVLGLANFVTGNPNWVKPHVVEPRWRSITQSLSVTGIDLTRTEYLEFWVWEDGRRTARADRAAVLLDFGAVFEDALAFEPDSFTVVNGDTTYYGQRPVGAGRLDSERDPVTRSWNAAIDDQGVLGDRVTNGIKNATTGQVIDTLPLCSATRNGQLQAYLLGDLRSRCGRRNGAVDTEDLDGDFLLDSVAGVRTSESFVRFVFPIGDDRYFVRDGGMIADPAGGLAGWRLYRIPFRTDTLLQGQPNLRQIQALRITVIAPPTASGGADPQVVFAFSRMRLVGSTWLKRAETPIRGIAGDRGTGAGEVIASVASTENRDLGYTPPPGVFDQADRRDANFSIGTTQINERSLRLLARGLGVGEHAEAYDRFTTEGDKNFLRYRKLRVWARGRGPGWEDGDLEFYIKVGKDENNFYLYHVPARTSSWEPEVVVDLSRWIALRARIEVAWLRGDTAHVFSGCPDTTVVPFDSAFVACDGPYVAHVRDPGTAPPNLAAVQEIAAGVLRVANRVFVDQAEVWVDDIRLSDVVQDVGAAGALDVTLTAANLADVAISVSRRDANFRQLGEDPRYLTDDAASVGGTVRLERFLPDRWGLAAPLTVRYTRTASAPLYLGGTDIRADALTGLRTPRSTAAAYTLGLRRVRRSASALGRWLLDPVSLGGSYASGDDRTSLSRASASSWSASLDYALTPQPVRVALPGPLRHLAAAIRVNPAAIRFRSGYAAGDASRSTYNVPIATDSDAAIVSIRSIGRLWRNNGALELQPLTGVQFLVDASSQRDLRDYGDASTVGRLARLERRSLFGVDVGLETQRGVNTQLNVTPPATGWLRPRATLATTFSLTRDPNARSPVRTIGDTAGEFRLPTAFSNLQRLDVGARVDLRRLGQRLFGDSARAVAWLARITGIDVAASRTRQSSFSRTGFIPALGYQVPWGGFEGFRGIGRILASAASDLANASAATGAALPLGLRTSLTYQHTSGVTWVLRGADQVALRTQSTEWPSGSVNWAFSPPRGSIGKVLQNISAQLGVRTRKSASQQASFSPTAGGLLTSGTDRTLTPSVSLLWVHGILTAFDRSVTTSDQRNAGNQFKNTRSQQNASLTFAFRPPASLLRLKTDIRTTARWSVATGRSCLQSPGSATCVPYVDSRQSQAQLTMDTDFPPTLSAGLQMAYLVNEERQINRKTAQLVITAFVQLNTSVGQIR